MSRSNDAMCEDGASDEVDLHQALVKRQVHKRIREMQADHKKMKQDLFETYKVTRVIERQGCLKETIHKMRNLNIRSVLYHKN